MLNIRPHRPRESGVNIHVTDASFNRAKGDISTAVDELTTAKDSIHRRVSAFLGTGWTGAASDSFVPAWEDWRSAAERVIEDLKTMGELINLAQRDFHEADDQSQQQLDSFASHIADRLG